MENPKLDALFAALANRHRREIILVLSQQPATITQLAGFRDLSLPAIHKHIKILEQAGLLSRKKIGRVNVITLNRVSLRGIQKWVTQFHAYWDGGAETLENYVRAIENK
jgi:DNA-binding transcriptional ArsR family regulator